VLFGDDDLLPCDLLRMVDKTMLCSTPPCQGFYSSINFVRAFGLCVVPPAPV
jgi:hypothetical protein